ncbi:hypothetical protein GCM10027168_44880 [Streptomyces capparidis]
MLDQSAGRPQKPPTAFDRSIPPTVAVETWRGIDFHLSFRLSTFVALLVLPLVLITQPPPGPALLAPVMCLAVIGGRFWCHDRRVRVA